VSLPLRCVRSSGLAGRVLAAALVVGTAAGGCAVGSAGHPAPVRAGAVPAAARAAAAPVDPPVDPTIDPPVDAPARPSASTVSGTRPTTRPTTPATGARSAGRPTGSAPLGAHSARSTGAGTRGGSRTARSAAQTPVRGLAVGAASPAIVQSQPPPGSCRVRLWDGAALPDAGCTPGSTNPAVTQATVDTTICVRGYSASVRPAEAVTEEEKSASLASYGDPDTPGAYEYDHLVSLELGGAVNDPANLWPEPGASPNPKDRLEDALHDLVCAHQVSLTAAQRLVAGNWVSAYRAILGTAPAAATTGVGAAGPDGRARSSGSSTRRTTGRDPSSAPSPRSSSPRTPPPAATSSSSIHPGAFCATPGATGTSAAGRTYTCRPDRSGRDRWRRPT